MNELKTFENSDFGTVRTMMIENEPWFVGKDVASILGYAKPLNALAMHVDEDDSLKQGLIDSMGRMQETIFINESGLYSLILSSKLPTAKKFKHWVTSEVLPSIRKHGAYNIKNKQNKKPALSSVNMMAKILKDSYKEAGVDPKFTVVAINNLYREQTGIVLPLPIKVDEEKLYDCSEIARELKIYSKTGKPHNKAISAIIQKLRIDDNLLVRTPFIRNGHSDFTTQYKPAVLEKIKNWLTENNYPTVIVYKDRKGIESTCYIAYQSEKQTVI